MTCFVPHKWTWPALEAELQYPLFPVGGSVATPEISSVIMSSEEEEEEQQPSSCCYLPLAPTDSLEVKPVLASTQGAPCARWSGWCRWSSWPVSTCTPCLCTCLLDPGDLLHLRLMDSMWTARLTAPRSPAGNWWRKLLLLGLRRLKLYSLCCICWDCDVVVVLL